MNSLYINPNIFHLLLFDRLFNEKSKIRFIPNIYNFEYKEPIPKIIPIFEANLIMGFSKQEDKKGVYQNGKKTKSKNKYKIININKIIEEKEIKRNEFICKISQTSCKKAQKECKMNCSKKDKNIILKNNEFTNKNFSKSIFQIDKLNKSKMINLEINNQIQTYSYASNPLIINKESIEEEKLIQDIYLYESPELKSKSEFNSNSEQFTNEIEYTKKKEVKRNENIQSDKCRNNIFSRINLKNNSEKFVNIFSKMSQIKNQIINFTNLKEKFILIRQKFNVSDNSSASLINKEIILNGVDYDYSFTSDFVRNNKMYYEQIDLEIMLNMLAHSRQYYSSLIQKFRNEVHPEETKFNLHSDNSFEYLLPQDKFAHNSVILNIFIVSVSLLPQFSNKLEELITFRKRNI